MPAIITHDQFAHDVLDDFAQVCGSTLEQRQAFLLGSQGPDPLFFLGVSPTRYGWSKLASRMHGDQTPELLAALRQALEVLDDDERDVGWAYAHGFLCHYALDSRAHPFVYAQQYALCDAGVEGLDRDSGSAVHHVIESELDELVLYTRQGTTVADWSPAANVLLAPDAVLDVVQKLYAYMALATYGIMIDRDVFPVAVYCFRMAQQAMHSPRGLKRAVVARMEELVRPFSTFRAMSHRPIELESSPFDNAGHDMWENPFTGERCSDSFWDVYDTALQMVRDLIGAFDAVGFDVPRARAVTGDVNFRGEPGNAIIVPAV